VRFFSSGGGMKQLFVQSFRSNFSFARAEDVLWSVGDGARTIGWGVLFARGTCALEGDLASLLKN
jgi:hypothetical protein